MTNITIYKEFEQNRFSSQNVTWNELSLYCWDKISCNTHDTVEAAMGIYILINWTVIHEELDARRKIY